MASGRFLLACLPFCALTLCSVARAQSDAPSRTTPLPPTTTLEHRVNPTGLTELPPPGWHTDFIGSGRGTLDASIGIKFWPDRLRLQNFIVGGTLDLLPGLRARAQFRQRNDEDRVISFSDDEAYLEAFNQYRGAGYNFGLNLRVGHIRYLHFPYPDAIAQFDNPTPIFDLTSTTKTDYRNILFQTEIESWGGWGGHFSGLLTGYPGEKNLGGRVLESYGFYRSDFGRGWRVEGRAGWLAPRQPPIGRPAQAGISAYLGKQFGEFNIGFLYEHQERDREYSGIMVQFRPGPVTKVLGRYQADYSRRPEGFTAQIPLYHGRIRQSRVVRDNDILVGEVRAVRIHTLFMQGYTRNEYEHRLASWGETSDPRLHCVVTEEPWYLQAEALTSPHLVPDARWERDRQGPGQYVQRVTYRFYRQKRKADAAGGA